MRLLKVISQYQGLPRPIYFIALARFLTALGAFVFPFLTLTLTVRLGMSPQHVGLVVSLIGISSMMGTFIGGSLADRYPRGIMILSGQILGGLALCLAGFVFDSLWILPCLFVCTFSLGLIGPSAMALIADICPRERRAEAYALGYMGVNLGFSVGPLIAGFLFHRYPAWIFWGDGLTTLVSAGCVGVGLRGYLTQSPSALIDQGDKRQPLPESEQAVEGSVWSVIRQRPRLIIYTLGSALLGVCYAQVNFTTPLALDQLFSKAGADLFGWVMAMNGAGVVLFTPWVTLRSKVTPPFKGLAHTGSLYTVGFGALFFLPTLSDGATTLSAMSSPVTGVPLSVFSLLIFSTALWTWGEVITVTQGSVFLANESPVSHRGRIQGVLPLLLRFTSTSTPLLMGFIVALSGPAWVWVWVALVGCLSALIFTVARSRW